MYIKLHDYHHQGSAKNRYIFFTNVTIVPLKDGYMYKVVLTFTALK